MKYRFRVINDNTSIAITDVKNAIEKEGLYVEGITVEDETRLCMTASGKQVTEEEFESLSEEELWFDDYAITFVVEVSNTAEHKNGTFTIFDHQVRWLLEDIEGFVGEVIEEGEERE